MKKLTIERHDNELGWVTLGELRFPNRDEIHFEYDIDYASKHFGAKDDRAVSVRLPVNLSISSGRPPAFVMDLIPQGPQLRKLMARYQISRDTDYYQLLHLAPLAPPGNLRIREPWQELEQLRPSYDHPGFTKHEIVRADQDFLEYMMEHGAPVGGTSGAAGGAPKFLLRQDENQRFHAEGMLDDHQTRAAYLIKFPFTDSHDSVQVLRTEKAYYDILKVLPLKTGHAIELVGDILFIKRFDRVKDGHKLLYRGLESFYAAHGIAIHGMSLKHEDNLYLLQKHSSDFCHDALEYLKRDLVNDALSNTDNHGRNSSLIKEGDKICLSPIYDVTCMKFFKGDFIVELTKWHPEHLELSQRIRWLAETFNIETARIYQELKDLYKSLKLLPDLMHQYQVPKEMIQKNQADRDRVISLLARMFA